MKLQRFEVSETPHLTITCHSDLDVNGGREGEVAVKVYGGEGDLQIERDEEHITITSQARCKIGCPRGTTLTLPEVHGDLRVRRVAGPITVENVFGDTAIKETGSAAFGRAMGDARAHSVDGDLRFDQVGGDLSVRGVDGALICPSVGGDLGAAYLSGGLEASVGGDASLKTDFTPGQEYAVTAGGDAMVRFPDDASVSVEASAGGEIHYRVDWADSSQTDRRFSGRLGDGEASLTVNAGGDVALQTRSDGFTFSVSFDDEGWEVDFESMAEEIERNIEAHMDRLNAQLDAKLSNIDHDAIRRRAERAAERVRRSAERAAEKARLKAERAQRRWERVGTHPHPRPARPAAPRRTAEPVTEEERMTILRMVQEGKISSEEAARLLEALEG